MDPARPLPADPAAAPAEYDGRSPIHYCPCGNVIGDGDYASGKRACAMHRRRRRR